ncbi:MAG: radical SAM protein [Acidobacteria bacterium]|nr:MAG: radical SAM protein [Acidobacteriota bacterium]
MPLVFSDAPMRVYWELTRACDLACTHCRACANRSSDPRELETDEIVHVLHQLAAGSTPHMIFTGGDPLKRRDFFEILEHARAAGLPCSVSPSVTPLLTPDVIRTLASLRIDAMSLSLDGSTAPRHDGLRGVVGTYSRTLQIAQTISASRISLQINTLVTSETVDDLPAIHDVVKRIGADRWSLFFLIATGRGKSLGQISPQRAEGVMNWAVDRAAARQPVVTTTEAPHYRRVAAMRRPPGTRGAGAGSPARGLGIRDGNGVMFISHVGEIQPSGFLPLTGGSVRRDDPLRIYRESPLFRKLRQTELFTGRCGCCEFRGICGGSRARAYAATGNPFESDPLCAYVPRTMTSPQAQ